MINHVTVKVKDFEKEEAFYEAGLANGGTDTTANPARARTTARPIMPLSCMIRKATTSKPCSPECCTRLRT